MMEDLELNPIAIGGGLIGGVLAVIVMSQVDVGLIYKIGSFIGTAIVCYFIVNKMSSQ